MLTMTWIRRLAILATMAPLLPVAGCAFAFPGDVSVVDDPASRHLRFIPLDDGPALPPVPAERVRVVEIPYGQGEGLLAEGLSIRGLTITARADHPTAEAPHRVVGEVRLDVVKRDAPADVAKVMAAEAGRRGANTLYLVDPDGSHWPGDSRRVDRRAVAVRLSDAAP